MLRYNIMEKPAGKQMVSGQTTYPGPYSSIRLADYLSAHQIEALETKAPAGYYEFNQVGFDHERIAKELRIHILIANVIAAYEPGFVPTGINFPFCGVNTASEATIVKLIYGESVAVFSTDSGMSTYLTDHDPNATISQANDELARLRSSGILLTNVTIEKGNARNESSYRPYTLTIARNIPIDYSSRDRFFEEFLDSIYKAVPQGSYFALSTFSDEVGQKNKIISELIKHGFTVLEAFNEYPVSEPVDKNDEAGIIRVIKLGDGQLFICQKI